MDATEIQFREALQNYESKNYKKAIAGIDKILKKNPMHSQSYALKALITAFYHPNSPDSKDVNALVTLSNDTLNECDSLIQNSVKYGPSNSISAHLSALYYRQIKNYEKAAHFYTIAYSNNSNNKAILRDLSSCLSQLRTYKSLTKTRLDYLQSEPGYRQNYSSTAIAYDLNGEYEKSIKVCDQIEDLIKDKLIDDDIFENSECIIYKATLLEKLGENEKLLKFITEQLNRTDKFRCYDLFGLLELQYEVLIKLEKLDDAQLVIRKLLKRNPDNLKYYQDLFKCLKIENNNELKLKVLEKLSIFYPKSDLPKFLSLTFTKGEKFESLLKNYLSTLFQRGVPSVFSNIKSLYKKHSNRSIILKIVQSLESVEENPLILTWIKYFIAQHYYKLKGYDLALKKIDEGIKITPTLIELYMYKARILKHQDKLLDAANEMNTARLMDLQDRFVNSKTVKYYLRADLIENAIDIASLFTKNEDEPFGIKDLHLVQCNWFISEYAEALVRLFKKSLTEFLSLEKENLCDNDNNNSDDNDESSNIHLVKKKIEAYLGLALQRFFSIFSIYAEYYEDQFDFHFYAFRKGTLRAYLETIRWSDELYHQEFIGRIYSDLMSLVAYTVENEDLLKRALDLSTTNAKRSKKDKKEELKWKENIMKYNKVYDWDILGAQSVKSIILEKDYSKLNIIEKLITRKDGEFGKPETLNFLKGEFNYEIINGKYVVSLSCIRKVKELIKKNNEEGEKAQLVFDEMLSQINKFIDTPSEDAKIQSLQKIVKLGLMRI
jgi:peptide alpha-N-acetyltransferase